MATYLDTHRDTLEREIDNQFPMLVPTFIRESIAEKVTEGLYQYVLKNSKGAFSSYPDRDYSGALPFAQKLDTPYWQEQLASFLQKGIAHLRDELQKKYHSTSTDRQLGAKNSLSVRPKEQKVK